MKRLFTSIIISLTLCFFLSPTNSLAGQATLAWDPPDVSTDVTGYMIHYGTASGTYSQAVDVGNTTSYTVSNLLDGQTYYFTVTAHNAAGFESVYSNEVSVMTSPQQYLLMVLNPGPGQGTVSGPGISCGDTCLAVYNPGTVVSLSATADPGSTFDGWSGEGCSGTGLCTVTMNANTTITANFKPSIVNYSITASAGTGGKISPAGTSSVGFGSSLTFSITPATGYRVASVTVDGIKIGAVTSYTFSNVIANHTIVAAFSRTVNYSITASAGTGGKISPAGTSSVGSGSSLTFSITPATGYRVSSVVVDGRNIGAVTSYTFSNVAAKHTIVAKFSILTYSITASAGTGGKISPAGTSWVKFGYSRWYYITPATGYRVSSVVVDGNNIGAVTSYTFSKVAANHRIAATFIRR